MGMKKVTASSIAFALMASTPIMAQTNQYDTTVARAAAQKAAEKIGNIRDSIKLGETPAITTKDDLELKSEITSFSSSGSPEAKPQENALPPVTSIQPELDLTVTGSISTKKPKLGKIIYWEKFDRYGNPIK